MSKIQLIPKDECRPSVKRDSIVDLIQHLRCVVLFPKEIGVMEEKIERSYELYKEEIESLNRCLIQRYGLPINGVKS